MCLQTPKWSGIYIFSCAHIRVNINKQQFCVQSYLLFIEDKSWNAHALISKFTASETPVPENRIISRSSIIKTTLLYNNFMSLGGFLFTFFSLGWSLNLFAVLPSIFHYKTYYTCN